MFESETILILERFTRAETHAWSFPSGKQTKFGPSDGTFEQPSLNPLPAGLYCFKDVFRDAAIVSIDCFWVAEEYSSFPDPAEAYSIN